MNADVNIRDLQLAILATFKEIIQICDENNINYFIVGGTAGSLQ